MTQSRLWRRWPRGRQTWFSVVIVGLTRAMGGPAVLQSVLGFARRMIEKNREREANYDNVTSDWIRKNSALNHAYSVDDFRSSQMMINLCLCYSNTIVCFGVTASSHALLLCSRRLPEMQAGSVPCSITLLAVSHPGWNADVLFIGVCIRPERHQHDLRNQIVFNPFVAFVVAFLLSIKCNCLQSVFSTNIGV